MNYLTKDTKTAINDAGALVAVSIAVSSIIFWSAILIVAVL